MRADPCLVQPAVRFRRIRPTRSPAGSIPSCGPAVVPGPPGRPVGSILAVPRSHAARLVPFPRLPGPGRVAAPPGERLHGTLARPSRAPVGVHARWLQVGRPGHGGGAPLRCRLAKWTGPQPRPSFRTGRSGPGATQPTSLGKPPLSARRETTVDTTDGSEICCRGRQHIVQALSASKVEAFVHRIIVDLARRVGTSYLQLLLCALGSSSPRVRCTDSSCQVQSILGAHPVRAEFCTIELPWQRHP